MKSLKIKLTAVVFIFAAAGAFASKKLIAFDAYTKKADIPTQSLNCMLRGTCDGPGGTCQATFGTITATLYDINCTTALNGTFAF